MISEDKVRNEYIRGSIRVASIADKMRGNRLKWLGDVLGRRKIDGMRIVKEMYVKEKRGNGRLKKWWLNVIENDKKRADIKC